MGYRKPHAIHGLVSDLEIYQR